MSQIKSRPRINAASSHHGLHTAGCSREESMCVLSSKWNVFVNTDVVFWAHSCPSCNASCISNMNDSLNGDLRKEVASVMFVNNCAHKRLLHLDHFLLCGFKKKPIADKENDVYWAEWCRIIKPTTSKRVTLNY